MGFVKESLIQERTLLTGRVGTLGLVWIAHPPFWASDNTFLVQPDSIHDFEFIYFCMAGLNLLSLNRGSTQPLLTQTDLGSQLISYPSNAIRLKFQELASPLFKNMFGNSEMVSTLSDLRDTLLPRLISGKLRVPEAEKMLEAVL